MNAGTTTSRPLWNPRLGHQMVGVPFVVFGTERYTRLVEVEKAYDPTNLFRLNHNVAAG